MAGSVLYGCVKRAKEQKLGAAEVYVPSPECELFTARPIFHTSAFTVCTLNLIR